MLFGKRAHPGMAPAPGGDSELARGRKTVIRQFERQDVDRWMAWPRHDDPLFESYNPPLLSQRQRDLYYQQRVDARDAIQFSVDDLEGEFIGRVSLRDIDWHLRASVLGISFHPRRLNQGLGFDALWTFTAYYFRTLRMSTLFLDVAAFNQRAYRVYEKCGFERCGQRWGDAQTDIPGVFRRPEYAPIRHLFLWDSGLMRPLLVDMVVRRDRWEQVRAEREATACPSGSPDR
jgi:diamine N-acetyltransferase